MFYVFPKILKSGEEFLLKMYFIEKPMDFWSQMSILWKKGFAKTKGA